MRRLPAFVLLLGAIGAAGAAPPSPLAPAEATFLDFLDAHGAVGAIDSGLWPDFKGRGRESWDAAVKDRHRALTDQLAALDVEKLSPADQAALTAMRVTLADWGDPSPAVANTPDGPKCADRNDPEARLRRPLGRARRLLPRDRQQPEIRGRHDRPRRRARPLVRPRRAGAPQGAARRLPAALVRAQRQQRARQPVPPAYQAGRRRRSDQRLGPRSRRAGDRRHRARGRAVAGEDPRGLARRHRPGDGRALGLPLRDRRGRPPPRDELPGRRHPRSRPSLL